MNSAVHHGRKAQVILDERPKQNAAGRDFDIILSKIFVKLVQVSIFKEKNNILFYF